jgi:hypothetical protein
MMEMWNCVNYLHILQQQRFGYIPPFAAAVVVVVVVVVVVAVGGGGVVLNSTSLFVSL